MRGDRKQIRRLELDPKECVLSWPMQRLFYMGAERVKLKEARVRSRKAFDGVGSSVSRGCLRELLLRMLVRDSPLAESCALGRALDIIVDRHGLILRIGILSFDRWSVLSSPTETFKAYRFDCRSRILRTAYTVDRKIAGKACFLVSLIRPM